VSPPKNLFLERADANGNGMGNRLQFIFVAAANQRHNNVSVLVANLFFASISSSLGDTCFLFHRQQPQTRDWFAYSYKINLKSS
jgi:hypothetical protein